MPETPVRSPAPLVYPVQVRECFKSQNNNVTKDEHLFVLQDYAGRTVAIKSPITGTVTSMLVNDGEVLDKPNLLCFLAAHEKTKPSETTPPETNGAAEPSTHHSKSKPPQNRKNTVGENARPDKQSRSKDVKASDADQDEVRLFTFRFFATLLLSIPISTLIVDFFWNDRWKWGGPDLSIWDFWGAIQLWNGVDYVIFVPALLATWVTVAGFSLFLTDFLGGENGSSKQPQAASPSLTKKRHQLARRRTATPEPDKLATTEATYLQTDSAWVGPIAFVIRFAIAIGIYLIFLEAMGAWLNVIRPSQTLAWSIIYNVGIIGIFFGTFTQVAQKRHGNVDARIDRRNGFMVLIAFSLTLSALVFSYIDAYPALSNFTGFGADNGVEAVLAAPVRSSAEQAKFETYFLEGLDR